MSRKTLLILAAAAAAAALGLGVSVHAEVRYSITNLGTLGGDDSQALGINNNGYIVGWSTTSNSTHGFFYDPTTLTMNDIGPVGYQYSEAVAINDNNVVAVNQYSSGGFQSYNSSHAFTWTSGGGLTALSPINPNGVTQAFAINSGDAVAGRTNASGEVMPSAAVWTNPTTPISLGGVPNSGGVAFGITDTGRAVGTTNGFGNGTRAFSWTSADGMIDINDHVGNNPELLTSANAASGNWTAGDYGSGVFRWNGVEGATPVYDFSELSSAKSVNATGQIAGERISGQMEKAAYWDGTHSAWLNVLATNTLGLDLRQATGINNSGQIVGVGFDSNGHTRAFLATPTSFTMSVSPIPPQAFGTWDDLTWGYATSDQTPANINPSSNVRLYGPQTNTTVKSLTIGATAAHTEAKLYLTPQDYAGPVGAITAPDGVFVGSRGYLSGFTTINGDVTLLGGALVGNSGQDFGYNKSLSQDGLVIHGTLSGYGIVTGIINADDNTLATPTGTISRDTDLFLGNSTVYSLGSAQIDGNVSLEAGSTAYLKNGSETVANQGNGTLQLTNGHYLSGNGTIHGNVILTNGRISASGGSLIIAGDLSGSGILDSNVTINGTTSGTSALVLNTTDVFHNQTRTLLSSGPATLNGNVTMDTGSVLRSDSGLTINATVDLGHGGSLLAAGGVTISSTAHLAGSGTINGDLYNDGALAPGNSPGLMTISGDLVQQNNGILSMELGGLTRGTEYDALDISGILSADGTLQVSLYGGFTPHIGDSFQLFNFIGFSGDFDTITLPQLSSGMNWDITEMTSVGVIAVVPEPGMPALLTLAGLSLLRRRRNRR